MNCTFDRIRSRMVIVLATVVSLALLPAPVVGGPTKLPPGLFVDAAPANAMGVGEARKTAQEGKPVVIRGRVGGVAKPIADKYAMFLMSDMALALCQDGCADLCHIPREQLLANLATVQVVDHTGRPLKADIQGMNGLRPLSEVIIQGVVAKVDKNVMIVNARSIFVNRAGK
ncbi:MAG: hypothetical protein RDU20_17535 [Desulfomonilaceae bacterium]|nr:hypothetical protein [Desulfomonilaceae bacterium]